METSFTVIIVNNVKNAITTINNRFRWELVNKSCISAIAQFSFYKNVFPVRANYTCFLHHPVAIARALYTDAPVLLLDEATSALDEQIEKKVLKNIREVTDKTVIIVSQRKAVLEVCDRCVVLEDKHFE